MNTWTCHTHLWQRCETIENILTVKLACFLPCSSNNASIILDWRLRCSDISDSLKVTTKSFSLCHALCKQLHCIWNIQLLMPVNSSIKMHYNENIWFEKTAQLQNSHSLRSNLPCHPEASRRVNWIIIKNHKKTDDIPSLASDCESVFLIKQSTVDFNSGIPSSLSI